MRKLFYFNEGDEMQAPNPNFTFVNLVINRKKVELGVITGFIDIMAKHCPSTKIANEGPEDAENYCIECIFDSKEFEKVEKLVKDYSDSIKIQRLII